MTGMRARFSGRKGAALSPVKTGFECRTFDDPRLEAGGYGSHARYASAGYGSQLFEDNPTKLETGSRMVCYFM
jgi:hypothetical protein